MEHVLSRTLMVSTVLGVLKSVGYAPSSFIWGKTLPYLAVELIWELASVTARLVLKCSRSDIMDRRNPVNYRDNLHAPIDMSGEIGRIHV